MKRSNDERRVVTGELLDADKEADVQEIEFLAKWLDSRFQIPGLPVRFGLDAILGLVPGLGDTVTSVISVYLLQAAVRQGVSRATLARMALNILVDYILGAVPFLGDLFDVYWKSNTRNAALLRRSLQMSPTERRRPHWTDWLILIGVAFVLAAFVALSLRVTYRLLIWLWG